MGSTRFLLPLRTGVCQVEYSWHCLAHRSCAGELRGHVVRSVPQLWDLESRGMVLFADLAGGSSFPSTPSTAAGSGQVLLSRDGTMAMAFMGVTGARKAVYRVW